MTKDAPRYDLPSGLANITWEGSINSPLVITEVTLPSTRLGLENAVGEALEQAAKEQYASRQLARLLEDIAADLNDGNMQAAISKLKKARIKPAQRAELASDSSAVMAHGVNWLDERAKNLVCDFANSRTGYFMTGQIRHVEAGSRLPFVTEDSSKIGGLGLFDKIRIVPSAPVPFDGQAQPVPDGVMVSVSFSGGDNDREAGLSEDIDWSQVATYSVVGTDEMATPAHLIQDEDITPLL